MPTDVQSAHPQVLRHRAEHQRQGEATDVAHQSKAMGKLLNQATSKNALRVAWYRIRANGNRSCLPETREAVKDFERNAEHDIGKMQHALRKDKFEFLPQKGILKAKTSGGFRGIVMAPVQNRIVERAWLDCLQESIPYVTQVIETPTSVGGVPDRSVPHGLALINDAFKNGKKFFVRSDISGFFDGIPRGKVLELLSAHVDDKSFLAILDKATTVILENEKKLGEDRLVFPINDEGVAQGSPLSPLFGNILLNDFDKIFNDRGIVCVRFIDDFIILGEQEGHVHKAFNSAREYLQKLNLKCHDPFGKGVSPEKAQHGNVDKGFIFLGYDIRPGMIQPSKSARSELLKNIDSHLIRGSEQIDQAIAAENSGENTQRYTQTLQLVDNVIRGWGNAFAYGNVPNTLNDLDGQIDLYLERFRNWFGRRLKDADAKAKRRAGGVCLLGDIQPKNLDELPFRLKTKKGFRNTSKAIVVSTDGSVLKINRFSKEKKGPGGWAVVFHDGREIVGGEDNTTNNRMELTAAIEALKAVPVGSHILIRTDSNYVYRTAEEGDVVKKNNDLWNLFTELRDKRQVKVAWVKGHAGDAYNEKADKLANEQATRIKTKRTS